MARPPARVSKFKGIIKDKASLIKAVLSTKGTMSTAKVAVLRATTHNATSPPPEHRLLVILQLGESSNFMAYMCVHSVVNRLHKTRSPYVALKSLILLHNFINRGGFELRDQLSFHASAGNCLNVARFYNESSVETRDLSSWVRWYASFLELNLITSKVVGYNLSVNLKKIREKDKKLRPCLDSNLLNEIETLTSLVEGFCDAPESLHCQRNNLVHEAMVLASEDYRATQHHITARLSEFGERVEKLSPGELERCMGCLRRLESCRRRVVEMLANRKRNDAFWELIGLTKANIDQVNEKREQNGKIVLWR